MEQDKHFIDISNMTSEEFAEYMHQLDMENRCPCVGCEKCQVRMQRHECEAYQKWAKRHIVRG